MATLPLKLGQNLKNFIETTKQQHFTVPRYKFKIRQRQRAYSMRLSKAFGLQAAWNMRAGRGYS
ncbi:MAG: hypothetical protein Q7R66_17145 [Undibacterium sp.]|nr:hypothetical protein [Undibacterium sp.]